MTPGQVNVPAPVRVALIGEGDLSHGGLAAELGRSLDGLAGLSVDVRLVEEPKVKLEKLAIRSYLRTGNADLQPLRWRLRYSARARAALRRGESPDVALVNTQACALLLGGPGRRVPTVLSVDMTGRQFAALSYWRAPGRLDVINDWPLEQLERRALRRARRVVAWTEWTARSVREDYGVPADRVIPLHLGVDLEQWRPRDDAASDDGRPMKILFAGNTVKRKGLDTLQQAVDGLDVPVELHVVTGDPVAERPGQVVHRGLKAGSAELRRCFAQADVFAFPTRADAVPWVIVEALAAGLPVVATDVAAIPELVGDAGALVRPDDVRALREALRALAVDHGRRADLRLRARRRAQERYDAVRQRAALAELLRECAR